MLCWEGLSQQDQVTVNKTKISNPSKKHNPSNKHMIYTTTLLFITPMENFTTFNVENPVYEITTHIFIQDECTHLLLDYILVRSLLLISLSFLPYSHKIWGTVWQFLFLFLNTLHLSIWKYKFYSLKRKQIWKQHNPFPIIQFHMKVSNF